MLPSLLINSLEKAARAAIYPKGTSHYDWTLLGFVLAFGNRLSSGLSCILVLFRRRWDAINTIQIKAATTAPISKYAVIKVPSIVMQNPFCVRRSVPVNLWYAKACCTSYQYHTCYCTK